MTILPLEIDQPLRMADVRATIERLFATGRYADIQVDAEPTRTVCMVRFLTKNSWFIGSVSAAGSMSNPPNPANWKTPRGSIWASPTPRPTSRGRGRPAAAARKRTACSAATSSRCSIRTTAYQQMNIRFEVDSGPRARFAQPVLTGESENGPRRILRATRFRRWLIHTWKPMTQTRVREAHRRRARALRQGEPPGSQGRRWNP